MSINKYLLALSCLFCPIVSTVLITPPALPENSSSALLDLTPVLVNFEKGESNSSGDEDEGLGSRGDCSQPTSFAGLPSITIIEPENSSNRLTAEASPTFLVYVPFELSNEDPGRFLVETEDGTLVYETVLRNSSGNEIIQIQLPSSTENLLETGVTYSLSFRVYCDDETMSNSTSFASYAEVTKVAPNTAGTYGYDELRDEYNSGSFFNSN